MLHLNVLLEASMTAGLAALVAENRKHKYNDRKCMELGWVGIPLVVKTYGCESMIYTSFGCNEILTDHLHIMDMI